MLRIKPGAAVIQVCYLCAMKTHLGEQLLPWPSSLTPKPIPSYVLQVRNYSTNVFFFYRFERDSYEWVLPENSPDFPIPFFVYADDQDENGTANAEVRVRIRLVSYPNYYACFSLGA